MAACCCHCGRQNIQPEAHPHGVFSPFSGFPSQRLLSLEKPRVLSDCWAVLMSSSFTVTRNYLHECEGFWWEPLSLTVGKVTHFTLLNNLLNFQKHSPLGPYRVETEATLGKMCFSNSWKSLAWKVTVLDLVFLALAFLMRLYVFLFLSYSYIKKVLADGRNFYVFKF